MILAFKKNIPAAAAVLLITAMAAAAELTGEREILFPEIAAIAAGALVSPKLAWNVSDIRMLATIGIGSVLGLFVVLALPLPLVVQMSLAFLCASVLMMLSRTSFAPLISSMVLPVMLQTRSVIYPVSAIILTASVILLKRLFERTGALEKADFKPSPKHKRSDVYDLLIRWIIGSIVITAAVISGFKLIAAPPLLVAFTEFWRPSSKAQKKPVKIGLLITVCAILGAAARYAALHIGFYQFIAAGAAVAVVFVIMKKTQLFVPPAAALTVLAFLIPKDSVLLYPLQVMIGAAVFIGISLLHGKAIQKQR